MMSQTGQKVITIYILHDISRSKENQIIKFDELIEYNIRNAFLKKAYAKCRGEASPRPFYKKSKLSIYLDQHSET